MNYFHIFFNAFVLKNVQNVWQPNFWRGHLILDICMCTTNWKCLELIEI
jgi:hypothetical protein